MRIRTKHMTDKDFTYIKALLSQGYGNREVAQMAKRGSGTVWLIGHSIDFAAYKEANLARTEKNKAKVAGKIIITNGEIKVEAPVITGNLDQVLIKLDGQFEQLKDSITEAIVTAVTLQIAEYKRDKDAEILALQTVVEASKSSNLVTNLTKRLTGFFPAK